MWVLIQFRGRQSVITSCHSSLTLPMTNFPFVLFRTERSVVKNLVYIHVSAALRYRDFSFHSTTRLRFALNDRNGASLSFVSLEECSELRMAINYN